MSLPPIHSVFVYGTLKRGHVRESMWPRTPIEIVEATILAELYDLGPYPAIAHGNNAVAGELWRFAADDVAETMNVLDKIEWYQQDDDDLYRREIVECSLADGRIDRAFAYFYVNAAELTASNRITPDTAGICTWPGTT